MYDQKQTYDIERAAAPARVLAPAPGRTPDQTPPAAPSRQGAAVPGAAS
ncbi:hypothetical protein [Streptomyces sp. NBC_01089]|nr:hypothetical protein OG510_35580 [Streptomyces sp. NBC_01089]